MSSTLNPLDASRRARYLQSIACLVKDAEKHDELQQKASDLMEGSPIFHPIREPESEVAVIGRIGESGNWVAVDPAEPLLVFRDGSTVRLVPRELAGEYKEWKTPQRPEFLQKDQD